MIRVKCQEGAVFPTKAHATDSGFDVTIIGIAKQVSPTVTLYKTGLHVSPPAGYYLDMVARSSLMKSGYMLANNVGVIDFSYMGEILVALHKFEPTAPDLELPARVAQLIPRQVLSFEMIQVDSLDETERGAGGFGSTGK